MTSSAASAALAMTTRMHSAASARTPEFMANRDGMDAALIVSMPEMSSFTRICLRRPCRSRPGLAIHLQESEYQGLPMLSRRSLLTGSAASGFCLSHGGAHAEAILTDDGLYRQPWFLESFLELADDLAAANEQKKRLAIMWELRGCPYCKEMHLVNFAKPEITKFIKENFEILQLNIIGSREVTDFDGEQAAARRPWRRNTACAPRRPFQFFPDSWPGLAAQAAEGARGRPHPGLSGAGRLPDDVPVRGGARLREGQPARLSQGEQLSRLSDRQSPCSAIRRRSRRRTARISGTHPSWSSPDRCSGACR